MKPAPVPPARDHRARRRADGADVPGVPPPREPGPSSSRASTSSDPHAIASATVGIGVKSEGQLVVAGTCGYLYVPAPVVVDGGTSTLVRGSAGEPQVLLKYDGDGLRYELAEFLGMIRDGASESFKAPPARVHRAGPPHGTCPDGTARLRRGQGGLTVPLRFFGRARSRPDPEADTTPQDQPAEPPPRPPRTRRSSPPRSSRTTSGP